MTILAAALVAIFGAQDAPPTIPAPDPKIAGERRAIVAELRLSRARIFVAARSTDDGELVFRYVELQAALRDQFISLFDRNGTYYDTPGVIGCVGDPYRVIAVWADQQSESWFAPACQRIMPAPGSTVPFDVALSPEGSRALRKILERALHGRGRRAG